MNDAAINAFLKGRLSRQGYAVATLFYIMAFAVLGFLTGQAWWVSVLVPWIWIVGIGARRFHDFGASGWWALLPFGLGLAQAVLLAILRASQSAAAPAFASITPLLVGAFSLGFMIWLGVRKGDPGPNRFGPPPKSPAPEEHFT